MKKEVKINLIKIIAAAILLAVVYFIDKFVQLPMLASLALFLVPYFIVGYDVIIEAAENILRGNLFDENFLMAIATVGALCIGFLPGGNREFAEAVFVMLFFKLGELFEEIAEGNSRKSISQLMDIRPDVANVERNGEILVVNPDSISVGEIIVIKPGEKVPVDGEIIEGTSTLDTVALTGESIPKKVAANDTILSGCINLSGMIRVRVTKVFEESTATKILDLVENANDNKSKSEKFISKFAKVYTPTVVAIAVLLAFIPPILSGNFLSEFVIWLNRALTFLVVSCPCALVISVPLTFFGGIGTASKDGILIKSSNYIDTLAKTKTVVFDKTGTLTEGVFAVTAMHPQICNEEQLIHLAAHVERYSTHPISLSIRQAYSNEMDDCSVSDVEEFSGRGIRAKVNGDIVCIGNNKMMDYVGVKWRDCHSAGTIIHVSINGEYAGHIVISDKIKEDSKRAISAIKDAGVNKIVMLTGDHKKVAEDVASCLKVDEYQSDLLPKDKVDWMEKMLSECPKGEKLAFVGDGINDAPVLARADVGIAMGNMGSDAAIESADVILMDDKPSKIAHAIEISNKTIQIAHQNIAFALSVKMLVLILASLGLAPMWLAIFADVGVTLIAVLNAMRTLNLTKILNSKAAK